MGLHLGTGIPLHDLHCVKKRQHSLNFSKFNEIQTAKWDKLVTLHNVKDASHNKIKQLNTKLHFWSFSDTLIYFMQNIHQFIKANFSSYDNVHRRLYYSWSRHKIISTPWHVYNFLPVCLLTKLTALPKQLQDTAYVVEMVNVWSVVIVTYNTSIIPPDIKALSMILYQWTFKILYLLTFSLLVKQNTLVGCVNQYSNLHPYMYKYTAQV